VRSITEEEAECLRRGLIPEEDDGIDNTTERSRTVMFGLIARGLMVTRDFDSALDGETWITFDTTPLGKTALACYLAIRAELTV